MMKRKLKIALLVIAAFLPLANVWAEKPPMPSRIVPDGLGYNIHFTDAKAGELEMLADSGATIVRMDFAWGGTEREKGVYDFSAYDRLTASLEKHKIRPLYILDYSNRHYDNGLSPNSPEGRAAFAKWAAAAVSHFKGRGILWEMYNEPNISFWKPEPKPDDYILLALETGKAIREAEPNEIYIGPATSGIDFNFLEQCFKAGLLEYWDAVSVHPYRQSPPETVIAEYAKLRYLIDKYAPKEKINGKQIPILSAEWGYSSAWGNYDDEKQGKFLPRQWMVNLACNVPISIWYDWHDDGTDAKEPEHHFGTTNNAYHKDQTPVYEPKPSYLAAKTFNETFRGFQYNKRFSDKDFDDVYVFLFANEANKDVRIAAWTTSNEPRTVTIPCSPGTFKVVSHLGKELPKLTADEKGLTLTVTDAPIYFIPEKPNEILSLAAKMETLPIVRYVTSEDIAKEKIHVSRVISPVKHSTNIANDPIDPNNKSPRFSLLQQTEYYVASPIIVNPPMMEGNDVAVQINNLGGEKYSAKLSLKVTPIEESQPILDETQGVVFHEGDTQLTLRFPLQKKLTGDNKYAISLFEPREIKLPPQTIHILENFSNFTPQTFDEKWGVFPDGDAKVSSEQSVELTEKGTAKITYEFGDGWKFLRFAPKKALDVFNGKPKSLVVRIIGDGSKNPVRLRFTDSSGQTFQPDGGILENQNAAYYTFDLTGENAGHWGGNNDGVVHYPIRFNSLVIDGRRRGPFTVEVFSPMIVYEE